MSSHIWKTYRDFVLNIEPVGEGVYNVHAQGSASGEGKAKFNLPFDEKDLEIFLLKIGRPRRIGNRGIIPQPYKIVVDFGDKLYNAVFNGDVKEVFIRARNEAEQKGAGLRLRLRLSSAPELADLPWEYLYDRSYFLALSTSTPLVRYVDIPSPPRPLAVNLPLRILVTISSPHDLPKLDIAKEQDNISRALAGLIKDGKLELEISRDANLQTIQRNLRQAKGQGRPFHAWHFIGHGLFDPDKKVGQLALTSSSGSFILANGFQLGTLFRDFADIRLIFLNACEGARNSRQDPFAGVATALIGSGIPAVIGMQFEISDEVAIVLSEGFYSSLLDGLPVDAALTEARRSIFFMPNWVEWATPVLFMRSRDGVLFKIQRRTSKENIERLDSRNVEEEHLVAEGLEKEKTIGVKQAIYRAEMERLENEIVRPEQISEAINHFNRAMSYSNLEKNEQAIAEFDEAIKLNPHFAHAYCNRGAVYYDLGKYDQTIADLNQAIQLNPQEAIYYYNRAKAYYDLGMFEQAINDFNQAIQLNPQEASYYYDRGRTYQMLDNNEQAISDYDRVVQLNPQASDPYYHRAKAYYDLGKYRQAIAGFGQAIQLNSQFALAYKFRSAAYVKLGKYEQAIHDCDQVIKLNPQDVDGYKHRGQIHQMLGNTKQSTADFAKAEELAHKDG